MSPRRSVLLPIVATAFIAAAMRGWYWSELSARGGFIEPVLDGAANLEWAKGFLRGTWPGADPFFRAPGYVVALAGLAGAAGGDAERIVAWQLALSIATPVLTALLAGRLFGNGAAWIAGLAAAVYPVFLFLDGQLLSSFLAVPVFTAAMGAYLAARERGDARSAAGAGLLFGIAGTAWPPVLLAGIGCVADLVRAGRKRAALAAAVAAAALPLVATLHNVRVGDPAFIATQGGLNLYLGNRPGADGMTATFAEAPAALGYRMMEAAAALAEQREGRELRESEVSAHYLRRTVEGIGEDPAGWLALVAKKAWLSIAQREIPNNHDLALFREEIRALAFPGWGLWAPLAAVALWSGRKRAEVRRLAFGIAAVLLGCIAFFVTERFRAPAAPLAIALGAGGAIAWGDALRRRRAREIATFGLVAGLAALFVWWNPYRVPDRPWILSYVLVAEAERNRGETVRALRWVDRALAESPGLYTARLARVELLRRTGRIAEARAEADATLAGLPDDAALLHERAILRDLAGESEAALADADRALARDPGLANARLTRAIILARLGRREEATLALREVVSRAPGSPEAERARALIESIARGELGAARAD